MKIPALLYLCLMGAIAAKAQMFYYCDTMTIGYPNGQVYYNVPTLGAFDLLNCNDAPPSALFSPVLFKDCTMHPNGELYGTGHHIYDTGQGIYKIKFFWGTGSVELLVPFSQDSLEALACSPTGQIYGAGKGLSLIDIDLNTFTYLGDFPTGIRAGGDLAFYKGQLYMTTNNNSLLAVDIESPSNSNVAWTFPDTIPTIQGLVSVPITCDSSVVYALGTGVGEKFMYRIDFESQTLIPVCDPGRFILGAAAFNECQPPPCNISIDADGDDDSGAFPIGFLSDTACTAPIAIVDEDVNISCDRPFLDSVTLKLTGILNQGEEYLESAFSGSGLTVLGSGSQSLKIESNQDIPLDAVEEALKSVRYINNAANIELGQRSVEIIGWIESNSSEVAVSFVNLNNNLSSPSFVVNRTSCYGGLDGSAQVVPQGGHLPYTILWGNGETGTGTQGLSSGYAQVTITESTGCSLIDSVFVPQPDTLTSFVLLLGNPPFCENTAMVEANAEGGSEPYGYYWGNGEQESIIAANTSATYDVTITDANGCTSISAASIQLADTVLVIEHQSICQGDSYSWHNFQLANDTIVCLTFTLPSGCDSTLCLALATHPVPQPQITVDGTLCNGGEVGLSVGGSLGSVEWSTGAAGPSISVASEGAYLATVTNSFGCSASASVMIVMPMFDMTVTDPSCHGRQDGRISIGTPIGGSSPYMYSINGVNFSPLNIFNNLPTGQYYPTVVDATGCQITYQATLTEPPPLSIEVGPDTSIRLGDGIVLHTLISPPDLVVSWEPDDFLDCNRCGSPTATPPTDINYTATISFGNGCEASDSVYINVAEVGAYYIPNAFSPNKDGINDVFSVFGDKSLNRIVLMEIYDRNGGLVFSANNIIHTNGLYKGWDGRIRGEEAQTGVFTYRVLLEFTSGKVETVVGTVTLVR